jgi:transposase
LKCKQDPEQVADKQACLEALVELEQQGHIDLFYGDESGFCLTPVMAYSWQYPGEQIRIFPQKGKRLNIFGLLSTDNRLTSFHQEGIVDTAFLIKCINEWLPTLIKPTVLVLDNAPTHQAKAFLAQLPDWEEKNLFIFFLPTYSPHLNKIQTLCRKVKYEWLKPPNYASWNKIQQAITNIFDNFESQYTIKFS